MKCNVKMTELEFGKESIIKKWPTLEEVNPEESLIFKQAWKAKYYLQVQRAKVEETHHNLFYGPIKTQWSFWVRDIW